MTTTEFLSSLKSRGAIIYPPVARRDIDLANGALQSRRCAMFPTIFSDLYNHLRQTAYHFGQFSLPPDWTSGDRLLFSERKKTIFMVTGRHGGSLNSFYLPLKVSEYLCLQHIK